ncbi:MAG: transposase [Nitrospirae bacterium]|nr:transposase [Nitrospirota bacterium]
MGRPLRIEYPGALYHITSRGNERKEIYLDEDDRLKFLAILEDYHERYGILIHSYVLMDNHYHLILETPKGNLVQVMQGINGGFTGYFNRRYGRSGHLFQGRYKGVLVDKDSYLVELSRYVHLNPVRASVVKRPEEYKWSSYPGYIAKGKEVTYVEYAWVLSKFGNDIKRGREKYRRYVEEGLKEGREETPLKAVQGQVVLGGEDFVEKIKRMLKGRELSSDILERKRFMVVPNPGDVIKEVAKTFETDEELIKKKGRKDNTARKAAIYFVQRYSGLSNEEIGKIFGGIHFSAVSKASDRLKKEMADDRRLAKRIEKINSSFKG